MNLRIFHVGDKKAVFNKEAFRHLLKEKCIRSKKANQNDRGFTRLFDKQSLSRQILRIRQKMTC